MQLNEKWLTDRKSEIVEDIARWREVLSHYPDDMPGFYRSIFGHRDDRLKMEMEDAAKEGKSEAEFAAEYANDFRKMIEHAKAEDRLIAKMLKAGPESYCWLNQLPPVLFDLAYHEAVDAVAEEA